MDANTDAADLKSHFESCGTIERVTIVCDKWTGKPKGCAYIQFKSQESVAAACLLNDKEFNGRIIKVCHTIFRCTFIFLIPCIMPCPCLFITLSCHVMYFVIFFIFFFKV